MKNYLIKSNYTYEIKANSKEEAMEKWHETIEEELAVCNNTIANEFSDSLEVKEIK